jgi:organic radical activating enzyme
MKKRFAFLKFHIIEDHKNMGSIENEEFFKNPVMVKTDRFLEKELRKIMQLGIKRPYTLVVDTAGCNKNCWFCYAYPIVKKKDYDNCKTIFLSPEELVKCFVDKMSILKNKVISKNKFFSKLRITGGEPLFSNEDTLIEAEGKNYCNETIDYFLKFFELLDPEINRLVREEMIFLSIPKKYSNDIPFPTFLCAKDNRIEIRFDTNGFLFADYDFAEKFISGIYSLLESNKLNNLFIKIDYSLKGVNPIEVPWSQNQELPVDESKIKDFKLEEHSQYTGLKNIFDLIHKYSQKDSKFKNCFGITVEPGINNVNKNYMYYKGSLKWEVLNKKLKGKFGESFNLSDVDNKMEVRGKIHTHLKRGVAVKVIFENGEFVCLPTDSKEKQKELFALLKRLEKENKKFDKIYIPYVGS